MKNYFLAILAVTLPLFNGFSQEIKSNTQPQISVMGEGKVITVPDRAHLQLGVQKTGKEAGEAKKACDEVIANTIEALKKMGIPTTDFKTTQLFLNRTYDYDKKKYYFSASQQLQVTLKDLSKYNELNDKITDLGLNNVGGVQFTTSKQDELEKQARQKAILDAKQKATDYVTPINQKIGKAILISDNSVSNAYENGPMVGMAMKMMSTADAPQDTLAQGEITIKAQVSVTFVLE
jgi:uncharacterized protein YggE